MTRITSGIESRASFCLEDNYGVTPSSPLVRSFGSVTGMSQDISANYTPYYGLGELTPPYIKKGDREVGISVEGLAHSNTIATNASGLFRYALGWKNNAVTLQPHVESMTIEQHTEKQVLHFKGSKIDSFSLEASIGEPINFSADFISSEATEATGFTTEPSPSGDPIMAYEGDVSLKPEGGSFGTLDNCSDWSVEISRNLERKFHIKATDPIIYDLPETQCELSGSLTLDFTSKSEYQRFMNDNKFDIKFELGSASSWIKLTGCKWTSVGYDISDTDLIAQDCELTASGIEVK